MRQRWTKVVVTGVLLLGVLVREAGPSAAEAPPAEVPATASGPATSEDPCSSEPVRGYGFDRYGGWKGLSRPPTGRFDVAEVDGRWWFFTPDGNAFFANGPTGIRPTGGGATATGENAYLDAVLATHGTLDAWADATFARTCDLGVRTLGGWNSAENLDLFAGRMAYTVNIDVYGSMPAVTTGPGGIKPRRDVFVADAQSRARAQAQSPLVLRCAADPWCIGVFVENEQPYAPAVLVGGGHLDVYLSQPAGSPGKAELQRVLAERHGGDIDSFNATWGMTLGSFDDLQAVTTLGDCPTEAGIADDLCTFAEPPDRFADRVAFEAHVAGTAAELADAALDEVDPAMLNLGPRLVIEPQLPEVLRALTAPVDVVSVNDYDLGPNAAILDSMIPDHVGALTYDPFARLDQLAETTGKPLYVTEWFYRLPRAGGSFPPFLPEVPDGTAQAAAVTNYLDHLHANPAVVGEAWFQWADQPAEGRASDGENQLHGIVDIDDQIRQPLFDTFAALNAEVIDRRLGPEVHTFTARFPASMCGALDQVAAAGGTDRAEIVRLGVHVLDQFAATTPGPLPTLTPIPTGDGACEVPVTWEAEDVAIVERAATAWDTDPDDLHQAGGRLVLAIIWWLFANP